ncbi:MAG TPA: alanine dehydrogenase [Cytophagales bacterium]|jgi:saccharopine dehydrogenase (NAD+, L-lysine-forming)|nr:alanine dehydrogenase [Cytophagales bacterium]
MSALNVGVIREDKLPVDARTPLTPDQIAFLKEQYPNINVKVQSSSVRCFGDEEYKKLRIDVVEDLSDCDVLFGVKEVPIDLLLPEKAYFFFSHTIKKQPSNQRLLKSILDKKITLIDYETLTNENGLRIIAFGRWAGIVGAYNALWTFGKKYNLFNLKRAHECKDYEELVNELKKVDLPPVKIVLTGNGRVAKGALEILNKIELKRVEPIPFIFQIFDQPVYTQIDVDVYTHRKDGEKFNFEHFFAHPDMYAGNFWPFAKKADILISAAFWDPRSPRLFELEQVKDPAFNIRTIADITCDIDGSIPTTRKATTIQEPVFDVDIKSLKELPAFSDKDNLSEMAVDNLPSELPRDASFDFGKQLIENVLPSLFGQAPEDVLERATIAKSGHLTERYAYLESYASGKE